jgi:hypothetical protein
VHVHGAGRRCVVVFNSASHVLMCLRVFPVYVFCVGFLCQVVTF